MIILDLPWPPTVNSYYMNSGRARVRSPKGRAFRIGCIEVAHRQLGGKPEALSARLHVHATFYPPDKRLRDLDNHWKALLDALTHANIWEDDSQIDFLNATRGHIVKKGKVIIEINDVYTGET